jgi:hypothetical protein
MEEEQGQPFVFRGRWQGRHLWILVCVSILAATLVVLLLWTLPSSHTSDEQTALAGGDTGQETAQPPAVEETGETGGGQAPEATPQSGGGSPTLTPGTGGSSPGLTIDFPDPVGSTPETPPPGGYEDVYGHWVLDMTGSAYALTNCHIMLEEDGTISAPSDYDPVFAIVGSRYVWNEGSPSFTASLQVILKMSAGQMMVPVQIDLIGSVAGSFAKISGDFVATPQGEAYAPYSQQGAFTMRR